jgi:chromosome segregation ATPase
LLACRSLSKQYFLEAICLCEWAAAAVKRLVVSFVIAQLVAGCVASSHELQAVRTDVSRDRQEAEMERQRLERRVAAVEANLQRLKRTPATSPQPDGFTKRITAVEGKLKTLEKSSALAVQMGLISNVQAESTGQGISGVRAEVDQLTAEIQALKVRLMESDKQLETGLQQLRDLSSKLK